MPEQKKNKPKETPQPETAEPAHCDLCHNYNAPLMAFPITDDDVARLPFAWPVPPNQDAALCPPCIMIYNTWRTVASMAEQANAVKI